MNSSAGVKLPEYPPGDYVCGTGQSYKNCTKDTIYNKKSLKIFIFTSPNPLLFTYTLLPLNKKGMGMDGEIW